MGCANGKIQAKPIEAGAPKPEKTAPKASPTTTTNADNGALIGVAARDSGLDELEHHGSYDVLATVREAERKRTEAQITDEQIGEMIEDEKLQNRIAAINKDSTSAKAYQRESLVSEEEIGFEVETEEVGDGSKPEMRKATSAVNKLSVEEPILPESSNDPDQVLVGGAGSD